MAYEFKLPKLSQDVDEGVVVAWFKRPGSQVREGEPLLEVQMEKVSFEVPAPVSGKLLEIHVDKDDVVRTGQVIALIETAEEAVAEAPAAPTEAPPAEAPPEAPAFVPASPAAKRLAREHGIDLRQVQGTGRGGRITEEDVRKFIEAQKAAAPPREVRASPAAKRLAREHGIDLSTIQGTGRDGRITEEDVRRAIAALKPQVERVPIRGMRATIARRMRASLQQMAQVTLVTEADVTELVARREALKPQFDLTYTDLVLKATALALKEHPHLNATSTEDELQIHPEIHIGLAVAVEGGLQVPVIRNVDAKSLREIAEATRAAAEKARAGRLTPEDVEGGTFTVTNLGAYDVDAFTPIINPPQVAILGVGRIVEKPAVYRGEITKRALMTLSLTFDHRVVDGAPAAAFLKAVKDRLERPDWAT